MRLLGITDDVTTCENCGKQNLKCTVALETESGEVVRYGRDCAAAAIHGSKSAKYAKIAEREARAIMFYRRAIAGGSTQAQAAEISYRRACLVIDVHAKFGVRIQTQRGNEYPVWVKVEDYKQEAAA